MKAIAEILCPNFLPSTALPPPLSMKDIQEVGDFDVIPTLKRLDLSYNSLTKLQGIESLSALETLNASHNSM